MGLTEKLELAGQRGAIKRVGEFLVEEVSIDERYLLDEDQERIKPICGRTKPNGNPCEAIPGLYTDHHGVGRCKFHHGNLDAQRSAWGRIIRNKKKSNDIISLYRAMEKFDEDDLENSLYDHIRMQQAIMIKFMSDNRDNPSDERMGTMFEMMAEISKNTKRAWEIRKGLLLTPKLLESLFDQWIATAKDVVGPERANQLFIAIVNQTGVPTVSVMDGNGELTKDRFKEIVQSEKVAGHLSEHVGEE